MSDVSGFLSNVSHKETSAAFDRLPAASELAVPSHPFGVLPSGNAYLSNQDLKQAAGCFSVFPDELLLQSLEYLTYIDLIRLGSTCKALFAFCRSEELWKAFVVESEKPPAAWLGSWRATHRQLEQQVLAVIDCHGLFSDVLHRPFVCAHTSLSACSNCIPRHNQIRTISDLSTEEYAEKWTDEPFILTDPVRKWPVFSEWDDVTRMHKHANTTFRAEAVDWPLQLYMQYMQDSSDESPLYLFDRSFVEKTGLKVGKEEAGDYWPPECFGADYFSVLGDQRPDRRWLIVGPARSGSTFHKDPNATSAWNAVLQGAKYWIMFPSDAGMPPPPGVFVSEDQSEVTSPLSIAEWLLNFHAEARATTGCREGICSAGEVLHVPSGWWHLVVNLSPSIAITQNFVPEKHLPNVLDFMKHKPEQISGFPHDVEDPYGLFVQRMQEQHPEKFAKAVRDMTKLHVGKKRKRIRDESGEDDLEKRKDNKGFTFGFADDDDADVP